MYKYDIFSLIYVKNRPRRDFYGIIHNDQRISAKVNKNEKEEWAPCKGNAFTAEK